MSSRLSLLEEKTNHNHPNAHDLHSTHHRTHSHHNKDKDIDREKDRERYLDRGHREKEHSVTSLTTLHHHSSTRPNSHPTHNRTHTSPSAPVGLSTSELAELSAAFALFDQDGSGSIDATELKSALDALGYKEKNKLIYSLINNLKQKELTWEDFLSLMTARLGEGESRDEVRKIFVLFDEDEDGYINLDDLDRISRELGENMSTRELKEMIQAADSDADGKVNFEDFYKVMTTS